MSILLVLVLLMVAATVEGNVSCITGSCDSREEIINVNQFTLESAWKGDLVAVQIMVKDWENDGWRLDWNSSGDENGNTALHFAAFRGHYDFVKYILRKSANINATNQFGDDALLIASNREHEEVVQLLLKNGANTAHTNLDGDSALLRAAYQGNLALVKLLVKNGANTSHSNRIGRTAATEAEIENYPAVIQKNR